MSSNIQPIKLVEANRREAFADSALVARKFEMKHNQLVRIIDAVLLDYPDLRGISNTPKPHPIEQYYTEERTYRGQSYTAYLMNRAFFSLVAMRCETHKARQWQRVFNQGFYAMEKCIEQGLLNANESVWLEGRKQSVKMRHQLTDVIKTFVEYSTAQGSKHALHYYKSITNAGYSALGLIRAEGIDLRKNLDGTATAFLLTAETLAAHKLEVCMDEDIPYKVAYKLVKDDLNAFCAPLRQMIEGQRNRPAELLKSLPVTHARQAKGVRDDQEGK